MDPNIMKNISALNPKLAHQIMDMVDDRKRIRIDKLEPEKYKFSVDLLYDLLDDKIDFILCDDWIDNQLAQQCAEEAKQLYLQNEMIETGIGKESTLKHDKNVRTDVRKWITDICNNPVDSSLEELVLQLLNIKEEVNSYASSNPLNIDGYEIQCAMYSSKGDFYLPHKDAFKIDKYNLVSGQKLRKITSIVYLTEKDESTEILHEVRPCSFERFAVSIWFHQTHMRKHIELNIEETKVCEEENKESTIFVSIPSYRDSQLALTIKSIYENADFPERVYIGVYLQINREEDSNCNIDELLLKYK